MTVVGDRAPSGGPSVPERKAHLLRAVDLRALVKNSGAAFKTASHHERVPCPICGAGGFATGTAKGGAPIWSCHGGNCGRGKNAIDFVMRRDGKNFIDALRSLEQDHGGLAGFTPERRAVLARQRAAAEQRARENEERRRAEALARLEATLARMLPLTPDTLAWRYLEDRALDMAMLGPLLRADTLGYVTDAVHPKDSARTPRPALVARITKPDDDGTLRTVAMQAIFLDPRPQAAPPACVAIYAGPREGRGPTARIWRPRGIEGKIATGSWQGAACRLFDLPDDGHVGAAEGIEKSLAVRQMYGRPCWAVMYADNFKTCVFEPGIRALTFYVDNNRPRYDARSGALIDAGGVSYTAAKARKAIDDRVQGVMRPSAGEDFSDLLIAWRAGLVDQHGAPRVSRAELRKALGAA